MEGAATNPLYGDPNPFEPNTGPLARPGVSGLGSGAKAALALGAFKQAGATRAYKNAAFAARVRWQNEQVRKRADAAALKQRIPSAVAEKPNNEARAVISEKITQNAIKAVIKKNKNNRAALAALRAAEAASTPQGVEAFMNTIRRLASKQALNATNLAQAQAALNAYNKSTKYRPRVLNNKNVKTLRGKVGWLAYFEAAKPRAVVVRQAPRRNTLNIGAAVANAVTQAIKAATTPAAAKKFVQTTPPPEQRKAFEKARGNVPPAVAKAMNPDDLAKAIVAAIEAGVKKIPPKVVVPALAPPATPANSRAVARALDPKVLAEAVVEAIRQGVKVRPELIQQKRPEEVVPELQKAAPNTGKVAENVARAIENAVRSAARPGGSPSTNKKSWSNWIPSFGFGGGSAAGPSVKNRISNFFGGLRSSFTGRKNEYWVKAVFTNAGPEVVTYTNIWSGTNKSKNPTGHMNVTSLRRGILGGNPTTGKKPDRIFMTQNDYKKWMGSRGGAPVTGQPPARGTPPPGFQPFNPNIFRQPPQPGQQAPFVVIEQPNGNLAMGRRNNPPPTGSRWSGLVKFFDIPGEGPSLQIVLSGTQSALRRSIGDAPWTDITDMRNQVKNNTTQFEKIFITTADLNAWRAAKAAANATERAANNPNNNSARNAATAAKKAANNAARAAKRATNNAAKKVANAAATPSGGAGGSASAAGGTGGGASVTGPTITFSPSIQLGLNKLPQAVQQARNDPNKMANLMRLVNNLKAKLPANSKTQQTIQQLFKEPNKLPTSTQVQTAFKRSYKNMNMNELLAARVSGKNRATINAHLRESVRTQIRRIGRLSGSERSTYMAELYRSLPKDFAGRAEVERELVKEVRGLGLRTSGGGYGGYGGYGGGRSPYESRGILNGLRRNFGSALPPRLREEMRVQERRIMERQGPLRQNIGRRRNERGLAAEGALRQRDIRQRNQRPLAAQAALRQTGFGAPGPKLLSQGLLKQGGPQLNIGIGQPLAPLPQNQQSAITRAGGHQTALQTIAGVPGGAPQVALAAQALNETNGNRQQALERGVKPEAINAVQKLGGPTNAGYVLEGLNTLAQTRKTQVRKAAGPRKGKKKTPSLRLNELNNVINAVKKRKLISLVAHNVTHTGIHNNENRKKKYYKKVIKSSILRRPLANKVRRAAKKTSNVKAKEGAKKR